ncbi:MAG: sigma-54 dependent transcriptional regulator [Gammaproteobacteria bacterium]|nr:sigma-54 dependent transcriptional regulator [Gammaproteobacteria bacterium]MDP2140837.1 sigma-54 dependent transcriptional regulator [Gammaproteobacteria bacterium]MDP2349420.1 sigma-54 dependent transcriptional regulator [Gammaproteobacteria bacterium]
MSKATILVAEDDWDLREALSDTLEMGGFRVVSASSAEEALEVLATRDVDMLVSDVNMDGMDGHELLQRVRVLVPMLPVLLITAYGSISKSVAAMRNGAVDYLVKPFDPQTLVEAVRQYVATPVRTAADADPVAEEASSRNLLAMARKVAASDATVLISGESGTGKEVLARYIHLQSPRADKTFVAINCAAIPENMLEATLFGHEKGAFTGAYNSSEGKFEQADGGTILLDEISEMDIGLQAKILRVLQEREVERVGGRKTISLDVRVIATTNRDLRQCVAQGTFREDLYYRLSVFPLQWLPLRERRKDIVPLAQRLLQRHARKMTRGSLSFDVSAQHLLENYPWPGNVRELDNVIQRALIMQDGNVISAQNLAVDATGNNGNRMICGTATNTSSSLHNVASMMINAGTDSAPQLLDEDDHGVLGSDLKQREFEIILQTLRQQGGRRKETAEVLGVSARTLRYKMARMRDSGINIESMLNVY